LGTDAQPEGNETVEKDWLMNLSLFFLLDIQTILPRTQHLGRILQASAMALALGLAGCRYVNTTPNDADALVAVRAVISEAGIQLPHSFQLERVHVVSCFWQESPDGYVCDVTLVATELPIIGAITVPMNFRFARRDGKLHAFLM